MYSGSYIQELLGQHGVEKGPYVEIRRSRLGTHQHQKG